MRHLYFDIVSSGPPARSVCILPIQDRCEYLGYSMATPETDNSQSLLEIANSILEKHRGSVAPPIEDAIAHAVYLYGLPPAIQSKLCLSVLWLYDEQGQAAKGDDLYIHDPALKDGPDLLRYSVFPARFLSQKYTMDQSLKQYGLGFIPWLMGKTGLTNIIRINKSGGLTPEFEFIMKHLPSHVCPILKDFWDHYQNDINHWIRDDIANHRVSCYARDFDGTIQRYERALKDTCVPSSELTKAISSLCNSTSISFLLLERGSKWRFLSRFGVKVTADLDFYLWLGAQSQFKASCNLEGAKRFLCHVANLTNHDVEKKSQARSVHPRQMILIETIY